MKLNTKINGGFMNNTRLSHKTLGGFTLIELMIVVVIVAVLAVLATPSFMEQVNKAKRSDGRAFLLDLMSRQERFYTQFSSYTSNIVGAVCAQSTCGLGLADNVSPEKRYTAAIVATPSGCSPEGTLCTGYTLTVTPEGWTDDKCGALTLTDSQVKGTSVTGAVDYCWR